MPYTTNSWAFGDALKLLHDPISTNDFALKAKKAEPSTNNRRSTGLGNFSKLWEALGTTEPQDAPIESSPPIDPNQPPVGRPLREEVYASDGGYKSKPKFVIWKEPEAEEIETETTDDPVTPTSEEGPVPDISSTSTPGKSKKARKRERARQNRIARESNASIAREAVSDVEARPIKSEPVTPASKASRHLSTPNAGASESMKARPAPPEAVIPNFQSPSTPQRELRPSQMLGPQTPVARSTPTQDLSNSLQNQYASNLPSHLAVTTTPSRSVPRQVDSLPSPPATPSYSGKYHVKHPQASVTKPTMATLKPIKKYPRGMRSKALKKAVNADRTRLPPSHEKFMEKTLTGSTSPSAQGFQVLEREERGLQLLLRLIHCFPEDKRCLTAPVPMSDHNSTPDGIHVFVDFSNIWIGFMDFLKNEQSRISQRIPTQNLSFDALVLLLERKRPVAKRVLAGSAPLLPAMEMANRIGYEMNVLDKVFKARELSERQRRYQSMNMHNSPRALGTQGTPSRSMLNMPPSETPMFAPEKWVEQGVDEILHLKMMTSIVDAEVPGKMVVATGDGAQAEYSEGFFKMVQRALKKGWYVELVAFRKSISYEYLRPEFQEEWAHQFKIIALDEWAHFLLET